MKQARERERAALAALQQPPGIEGPAEAEPVPRAKPTSHADVLRDVPHPCPRKSCLPQYLATRLFEVRSERDRLRGLHELTSRDLERTREQEASARAQLAHERDGASRLTAELRAEHAQQLAEARERSAAEMAEAAAKAEAERARVRDQYQAKVDAAEERCAQLAAQVRSLSDGKYALDVRVSELSAKLGSADGELSAARAEVRGRWTRRLLTHHASLPFLIVVHTRRGIVPSLSSL